MEKTFPFESDIGSHKEKKQTLYPSLDFPSVSHNSFHFDSKVLKNLAKTVQFSHDDGVCCMHCGDTFRDLRFICISCEDSPSICEDCLNKKHDTYHVTIRKTISDWTGGHDDDLISFLPYEDINRDTDLIGSYTTCSSLEKFEALDYNNRSHEMDDSSSSVSSEWDRVSLDCMPNCFNLDRPPDLYETSLTKVPSCKVAVDGKFRYNILENCSEKTQDDPESCDEGLPWADPPEDLPNSSFDFQSLHLKDDLPLHQTEHEIHESFVHDQPIEDTEFQPACDVLISNDREGEFVIRQLDMLQASTDYIPRRRTLENFERSFQEVGDPFSEDSMPDVVDLITHAAHQVSGAAMKTVDTLKKVFKVFQYSNLQSTAQTNSYDWIPPSMRWTGDFNEHPTTPEGIMTALIQMGFADRYLNSLLIKKFECNFERIIDHITTIEYGYSGWA